MNLEDKKKLVLEKNPTAFRTGTQGVEGNFWFYEAHVTGTSFKFRVDTNLFPKDTFQKKMDSVNLVDYMVEY
jgi:hypothetical protein